MKEKGNLDSLRDSLYSSTAKRRARTTNQKRTTTDTVRDAWEKPVQKIKDMPVKKKRKAAWWFFLGSVGFFVLAIIIAALIFLTGGRTISANQVALDVNMPATVGSGEAFTTRISIRNNNPVTLPFVELTVTYPEGTRSSEDINEEVQHLVESIGPLAPGEQQEVSTSVVLFGEEGEEVDMLFSLEFRAEGSNAIVVKEERLSILISSAPVAITVDSPTEVGVGDPFTTVVTIQANTEEDVPNVVLMGAYPFGFVSTAADPDPSVGDNVWELGTLEAGERRTIDITGSFAGQSGEERYLTFTVGTNLAPSGGNLGVTYMEQEQLITLENASLALGLSINRSTAQTPVVSPDEELEAEITYVNNLNTTLYDGEVTVTLTGNAYDPNDVSAPEGFYRESAGTITYSRDTDRALGTIEPGERGTLSFRMPIQDSEDLASVPNPNVEIAVTMAARRAAQGNTSTVVRTNTTKTVAVNSTLSLNSTLTYTDGPFVNTGPWPPEADETTEYTLTLSAESSTNTVANTAATFSLPVYATYTGNSFPNAEGVVYNEGSKTITWTIGELVPGKTATKSFQVAIEPSTAQVGESIVVVNGQTIEGYDRFSSRTLSDAAPARTTQVTQDSEYSANRGIVTE